MKTCPFCKAEGQMHACTEIHGNGLSVFGYKVVCADVRCGVRTPLCREKKDAMLIWEHREGEASSESPL